MQKEATSQRNHNEDSRGCCSDAILKQEEAHWLIAAQVSQHVQDPRNARVGSTNRANELMHRDRRIRHGVLDYLQCHSRPCCRTGLVHEQERPLGLPKTRPARSPAGEVVPLEASNIDLDARRIRVRHTAPVDIDGSPVFDERTQGERQHGERRAVPSGPHVVEHLRTPPADALRTRRSSTPPRRLQQPARPAHAGLGQSRKDGWPPEPPTEPEGYTPDGGQHGHRGGCRNEDRAAGARSR